MVKVHWVNSVPICSFLWSVFSHILAEYGEILFTCFYFFFLFFFRGIYIFYCDYRLDFKMQKLNLLIWRGEAFFLLFFFFQLFFLEVYIFFTVTICFDFKIQMLNLLIRRGEATNQNTGKYGPQKTLNLKTFHAVVNFFLV